MFKLQQCVEETKTVRKKKMRENQNEEEEETMRKEEERECEKDIGYGGI